MASKIAVFFLAVLVYFNAFAQDASITEADAITSLPPSKPSLEFSSSFKLEAPEMAGIVEKSFPLIDVPDSSIVYYQVILSLQDSERKQGLAPNTLVNRYLAFIEQEKINKASEAENARDVFLKCPANSYYVMDFPNGLPLCAPDSTYQGMENHRFSCAQDVFSHTYALNSLFKQKYNTGYPIYDYWTFYPQAALHQCKNGTVWGDGAYCNLFENWEEASIDHWHCNEHLRQLKDLLKKESVVFEKPCNDLGWKNGNVWKPISDTRPNQGVVILEARYCDGLGGSLISNFRVEDALGAKLVNDYFDICNKGNAGRLHQRFSPSGTKISGPAFVRYDFNGKEECRKVPDPSIRIPARRSKK